MDAKLRKLMLAMIEYNSGDARRIQHLLKVHTLAKLIGEEEKLDDETLYILETAALTHDIGIRNSEKKYGSCNGKQQELEGPPEAEKLLRSLDFPEAEKLLRSLDFDGDIIERVCWLIAHHHTYNNIEGADYRILVEADFLVNLYEDGVSREAVQTAYRRIFKTESGRAICRKMYAL